MAVQKPPMASTAARGATTRGCATWTPGATLSLSKVPSLASSVGRRVDVHPTQSATREKYKRASAADKLRSAATIRTGSAQGNKRKTLTNPQKL